MNTNRRIKVILIIAATFLGAGLYFAPHKPSDEAMAKTVAEKKSASPKPDFNRLIEDEKKAVLGSEEGRIKELEKKALAGNDMSLYDSLGAEFDRLKRPAISASYYEIKAKKEPTEKNYLNAAYRFFDAYKNSPDSLVRSVMVQKAIENYAKVTELNPDNLDAKSDLGVLYAEGTAEPMKGIMLLREVVTKNPKHENATLNLGLLSVKSGQYDKALERFDQVLNINPKRIDMYVFKAQVYEQMGNKKLAIENFKKFQSLTTDDQLKKDVNEYIKGLEK